MRSEARVASTASPIAPPTWTLVLTSPEARPESSIVAPDIASVISDGKPSPAPAPIRIIGGTMSVMKSASTGVSANSSKPAPMKPRLGSSAAFGPNRIETRSETFSDMKPITTVAGRNAKPTSSAL